MKGARFFAQQFSRKQKPATSMQNAQVSSTKKEGHQEQKKKSKAPNERMMKDKEKNLMEFEGVLGKDITDEVTKYIMGFKNEKTVASVVSKIMQDVNDSVKFQNNFTKLQKSFNDAMNKNIESEGGDRGKFEEMFRDIKNIKDKQ